MPIVKLGNSRQHKNWLIIPFSRINRTNTINWAFPVISVVSSICRAKFELKGFLQYFDHYFGTYLWFCDGMCHSILQISVSVDPPIIIFTTLRQAGNIISSAKLLGFKLTAINSATS